MSMRGGWDVMKKLLKNKNGMTLVTVIIIMTVLVLLCGILAESVVQTFTISKRHRNIDYAYYAGESAIEKWAAVIDNKIVNKSDLGDSYSGSLDLSSENSRKQYAEHIINNHIQTSLFTTQLIDVEGKGINEAVVEFDGIELVGTEWDSTKMGSNSMDILIGLKAKASYSSTKAYNAGNKQVYAVKRFRVSCPVKSELEGAVYTVGDFYVNGKQKGEVVKVKGDVFTFGSYAKGTRSPRQSYFGGIFAINGAKLNIYGNAYSRSFIRTGPYRPLTEYPDYTANDSSRIVIFKDAIAECIQSFGNDDVTVVLGNAYTFDDIEVNGQNSVIAVNGSFIGLSKGGSSKNHDMSSAIVNSAIVHQQMAPDAFKSKITINGDVLIAGSTMKIDDNGVSIGTIEDASVAFNDLEGIPHYKWWPFWGTVGEEFYHKSLRDNKNNIKGIFNQFQLYNMLKPFESSFNENQIDTWINRIRSNDFDIDPQSVTLLRGITSNEVAANDTLYQNPLLAIGSTDDNFDRNFFIRNDLTPMNKYWIDNIFSDAGIKYDSNYWNNVLTYEDLYGDVMGNSYDLLFKGKCGQIHKDLLDKVQKFASREYKDSEWEFSGKTEFDRILQALKTKSTGNPSILYINRGTILGDKDINELFDQFGLLDASGNKVDVYDRSKKSRDKGIDNDDDYFIFANAEQDLTIRIKGPFNGIIVTAGKVILEDGASVYGSIIAAGGGYYNNNTFIPQSKEINSTAEERNLENGDYAAIYIEPDDDTSTPPAYVDFFLGVAGGPNDQFKKEQMKAVLEKSLETSMGMSLLSSFIDASGNIDNSKLDDALVYLNKAARINLLDKFEKKGIYLYDIF